MKFIFKNRKMIWTKKLLLGGRNYALNVVRNLRRRIVIPDIPVNPDGKVYVNLGCGMYTGEEFINIDTRILPHIHHIGDISNLSVFGNDSVDLLYASHLLEHIPRSRLNRVIGEWRRVIKPGGVLRISVPDFDRLNEVYNASGNDIESIVNQLMGQDPPYDAHFSLWNIDYAQKFFTGLGFQDISVWNPHTADHHDFIDKASRTMKAGDRDVLISLNVEMKKVE